MYAIDNPMQFSAFLRIYTAARVYIPAGRRMHAPELGQLEARNIALLLRNYRACCANRGIRRANEEKYSNAPWLRTSSHFLAWLTQFDGRAGIVRTALCSARRRVLSGRETACPVSPAHRRESASNRCVSSPTPNGGRGGIELETNGTFSVLNFFFHSRNLYYSLLLANQMQSCGKAILVCLRINKCFFIM